MTRADYINPKLVLDPIIRVTAKKAYPVLKSGNQITYKVENATTFSTSSIHFSFYTPNYRTMMNRRILMRVPIQISMTSADTGQLLFQSGQEAPREWALASAISTIQAQLNNQGFSINMSDIIHPLAKYGYSRKGRRLKGSTSTAMPDYYQDYAQGVNTSKNPLASYVDESAEIPRGAFNFQITTNTNTAFVATFDLVEPIFMSPFEFGDTEDEDGFLYIQTMDLTLNFESSIFNRIWSRSSTATPILTGTIAVQQPSLLIKYVTPNDLTKLPSRAVYNYFNTVRYITNNSVSFPPNSTNTIISNNIQLHSIPHRIYAFVRRSQADLNSSPSNTDTFFNISRVDVQFNNNAALLSTAQEQDLYMMSVRNGYSHSFQDWTGVTQRNIGTNASQIGLMGSVLCLMPSVDLQLPKDLAAGQNGTFNFQIQITCKNVHQTDTIVPHIYLIMINQGVFVSYDNGITEAKIGPLTPADVIRAQKEGVDPLYQYDQIGSLYGGGSFFGQIFKNIKHGVQSAIDIAKHIKDPGKVAEIVGKQLLRNIESNPEMVMEGMKDLRKMIGLGGKKKRGRPKKGGRKISKKELMERLSDYM